MNVCYSLGQSIISMQIGSENKRVELVVSTISMLMLLKFNESTELTV